MANIYINKQTRQIFADRLCRNPLSFDSLLPTAGAEMALVLHAVDANGPSTLTSPAVTIASKDVPAGGTITLSYNGTSLGEIDLLAGQAEWEAYINANASVAALGGFDAFVTPGRVVLQSRAVGTFSDFAVVAHDFVPFGTAVLTQTAAGDANEREIWVLTMELGTIAVQNSFSQSSTVAATITELVTGSASVAEVQRITLSGEPIRGYWNITTASGVTLPLKWDVGPRHIEAAMNTKLGAGTVVVSQSAAFSWDIAWTAVGAQSALTATVSGLTGLQASTGTLSLDTNEAEALPRTAACQVQITDGTEVIYSESVSIGNLNLVGDTPVTQTAGVVRYDTAQTLTSGETAQARDNIDAAGSGAVTASGITMTTARLLGRTTAGTGAIEEIAIGTGLTLSAGTLSNSASASYGGNGAADADKLLKFSADGAIYASIEAGVTSSNGSVVALSTDGSTIGVGFAPLDVANGFTGLLRSAGSVLDQNTTWTLPNASGTIALTSNLSAYAPLAGAAFTGYCSFTSAGGVSVISNLDSNIYTGITSAVIDIADESGVERHTQIYSGYASMTGYALTGSSDTPFLNISGTWNTSGTPTALKLNVTDTASNASSLLADFQVGGVSKVSIAKSGACLFPAAGAVNHASPGVGNWYDTLGLFSGAGVAATISASAMNFSHGYTISFGSESKFTSLSEGVFRLGGAASATPVSQTLSVQNASGTNIAGADRYIDGSQSTGSAAGGSIIFRTSPAGGAGAGTNALATAFTAFSNGDCGFAGDTVYFGTSTPSAPKARIDFPSGAGDTSTVDLYNGYGGSGTLLLRANQDSFSVRTCLGVGISASSPLASLYSQESNVFQMGSDHNDTPTAQTLKSHDVTTGTGASMTIAGGKGSVAGGSVILATSATNVAPVTNLEVKANGSVAAGGQSALATNATDGFLYVPTCAGTPTGAPTAITGLAPIVVDTTNNKLYFYSGGSWRDAGP